VGSPCPNGFEARIVAVLAQKKGRFFKRPFISVFAPNCVKLITSSFSLLLFSLELSSPFPPLS
jgi:hypothetical protein